MSTYKIKKIILYIINIIDLDFVCRNVLRYEMEYD